jgi:hypothetical protein
LLLLLLPLVLFASEKDVRPCLQTGPWYPADPAQLQKTLDGFFAALPPPPKGAIARGLIAPHAGMQYSGRCAAKAYGAVSAAQGVRRVILLGSSHRSGFYGACVADYQAWSTPLGSVPVDTAVCRELAGSKLFKSDRDILRYEHALENQLPFLQRALAGGSFKIVPVVFGALDKKDFAAMAATLAPFVDAHTLVVASSDLTHYGESFSYVPFRRNIAANLEKLDKGFIELVLRGDFAGYYDYHKNTGITACGFAAIGVMMRMFENKGYRAALADYARSGDLNGDYSTSVSYASILFSEDDAPAAAAGGLAGNEKKLLLELARSTLRDHFQGKPAAGEERTAALPRLQQALGVFVTLRKQGQLRGCIGSIVGVEPLYRGVRANALHAAFDDPRFPALREKELDEVEIEISVMTPLRRAADYRAIRLGRDGVVIRDGHAQAVFLPQVATETGWTLDEFLGQLCLKARLERSAYRASRSMQFFVFQAQVFSERQPGT